MIFYIVLPVLNDASSDRRTLLLGILGFFESPDLVMSAGKFWFLIWLVLLVLFLEFPYESI